MISGTGYTPRRTANQTSSLRNRRAQKHPTEKPSKCPIASPAFPKVNVVPRLTFITYSG
jgi:hypothetical protein